MDARKPVVATIILLMAMVPGGAADPAVSKIPKRVEKAYEHVGFKVKQRLKELSAEKNPEIIILGFKEEARLEIWAAAAGQKLQLAEPFEICQISGKPGPKRKQGDYQTPEGFYTISRFNPYSRYHLAMEVSYPNKADQILKTAPDPGGAIMIHGACVTIGCLPMTNEGIEAIYVYADLARKAGQNQIPVYLFPSEPGTATYKRLMDRYPEWRSFWKELDAGYQQFQKTHRPIRFQIGAKGNYLF